MAMMRSSAQQEDLRRWAKESKMKAHYLLSNIDSLAQDVFSSQDNYVSFLNLTTRIHHYDTYNLLLIWNAYPRASYLAGYRVWERQLPPGQQILKKEHTGKGIALLAPFTDIANDKANLTWHSRSVFDVSQTTSALQPPAFDPVYIMDQEHEYFLLDAIQAAIGNRYHKRLLIRPPSLLLQDTGLPGGIHDQFISARDDLSEKELLYWLTEAMSHLSIREASLSAPSERLLENSICYCLFRIWGLSEDAPRPGTESQLESVSNQPLFLNLLRDNVRELNNAVGSYYLARRRDEEENALDLDDLFDIPPHTAPSECPTDE